MKQNNLGWSQETVNWVRSLKGKNKIYFVVVLLISSFIIAPLVGWNLGKGIGLLMNSILGLN